jgi:hypothetical protein
MPDGSSSLPNQHPRLPIRHSRLPERDPRSTARSRNVPVRFLLDATDMLRPALVPKTAQATRSAAEAGQGGKRDEGVALIIVIRLLQLLIIVVLWLLTAYFGGSCFDPSGIHQRSAAQRRSDRSSPGQIKPSADV